MTPLVTVLVPNYNHARFLPQRMDSILAQTFRDFELIGLDDASSDDSRAVLSRYAERAAMRLVFNETNSGSPIVQWRRGAQLAAGKYLWIAESDDYADPRFLEVMVSRLEQNPNVGLAYCQSHFVDDRGQVQGTWEHWTRALDAGRWKHSFINRGPDEAARYLVFQNTIPNASAVLVRKDLLLEGMMGTERMRLAGDWWTWARVLMRADVAFVAEPLNYFRSHSFSVRDTTKLMAGCTEGFAVIAHICSHVPVSPVTRRRAFQTIFNTWQESVDETPPPLDLKWLRQVHADARQIHSSATIRMALHLSKRLLKRIGILVTAVRGVKRVMGRQKLPNVPAPATEDTGLKRG
jgi:hypothetical protein